jgi:hypothetical protein
MFSSEQKFSVNGSGREALFRTIDLALWSAGTKVASYRLTDTGVLLYWHERPGTSALPKTTKTETVSNLIWDHLSDPEVCANFKRTARSLDIDGSKELGWKVFLPTSKNDPDNHSYALLGVSLEWLYFAK